MKSREVGKTRSSKDGKTNVKNEMTLQSWETFFRTCGLPDFNKRSDKLNGYLAMKDKGKIYVRLGVGYAGISVRCRFKLLCITDKCSLPTLN
jgi:hypothetical protein